MKRDIEIHDVTYWQPEEVIRQMRLERLKDFDWLKTIRDNFGLFSISGTATEYLERIGYANLYNMPTYAYNYLRIG